MTPDLPPVGPDPEATPVGWTTCLIDHCSICGGYVSGTLVVFDGARLAHRWCAIKRDNEEAARRG